MEPDILRRISKIDSPDEDVPRVPFTTRRSGDFLTIHHPISARFPSNARRCNRRKRDPVERKRWRVRPVSYFFFYIFIFSSRASPPLLSRDYGLDGELSVGTTEKPPDSIYAVESTDKENRRRASNPFRSGPIRSDPFVS